MNRDEMIEVVVDYIDGADPIGSVKDIVDALWPVLAEVWEEAYLQGWRQRNGQGPTPNPYSEVPT